mgnify:CR=1 FL=1
MNKELSYYLLNEGKAPVDYILDKFKDHDIVLLGEMHYIRQQVELYHHVIPLLADRGITIVATEFGRRADQELIDDLLSREHIYSKLEINIKKDILLFTSQPLPQSDLLHRALIKAMESFPDKHLVIKMHPLESGIRSFLKVKGSKLRNISLVKDIDTWSLINSSKLLITISSITAAEAMMLKKPVVLFGLNPEPVLAPLIEAEAVFPVNRFRDLPLAVEKILTDDSLKERLIARADKFIQENLGPHEGQVDKRTKDLINSLISR